jgi:ABC-type multidrug transport system fused ATPase/permease subunit
MSLADNVAYGLPVEADRAQVVEAAERAQLTKDIADLPQGFDTLVGERGVTLSGGQRQRSCIARALARNPRVLILDDALSAVDTETEAKLMGTLRDAGVGRTVVLAAHRLATVRHADQILALSEGRVEALGTHDELLERSDWYRQTWERQQMEQELEEL